MEGARRHAAAVIRGGRAAAAGLLMGCGAVTCTDLTTILLRIPRLAQTHLQEVDYPQGVPTGAVVINECELVRHLDGGVQHEAECENVPEASERAPR